jgi:osmoprotectant transport system ATP-binding protein
MITAHNLIKKFNRAIAVDDVSFEVKEGENLVLLGTSGCGKTTTLKMINRLIEPSSGKISINGKDISNQSPEALRRSIGYVLQQNSLFPHYTVAGNIAVVPNLLGWDKKKIELRTAELLERLNLPVSCLSVYPHELSGGQQQRVNIARALAADPPILLMDEPFGALDNITRTKICNDFSEIKEFMAKTIIMVTHDVQEAFRIGDRIALINGGKIVQAGKPTELLFHPVNDFVRDFFSSSYLRLALGVVKVQDIWGQLPSINNDDPEFNTLSKNEDLWNLLEHFTKSRNQYINLQNSDGQIKQLTQTDLLNSFNKHVNHL